MKKVGSRSPWGTVQEATEIADGITWVSTAGHGGVFVSAAKRKEMKPFMVAEDGWYEEDCEAAKVIVSFPHLFSKEQVSSGLASFRNWYPDLYEEFIGTMIKEGESLIRDEEIFNERNKNEMVAVSAYGDWHHEVPKGFVVVYATKGGLRTKDAEGGFFKVPLEVYEARKGSFVVSKEPLSEFLPNFRP